VGQMPHQSMVLKNALINIYMHEKYKHLSASIFLTSAAM
jgi:hypothetical protein